MGPVATGADNADCESFHPSLKREALQGPGCVGVLAYCVEGEAVSDRRPAPMPAACAGEWE